MVSCVVTGVWCSKHCCCSCWFTSRHNSKCWSLKPFTVWDQGISKTTSIPSDNPSSEVIWKSVLVCTSAQVVVGGNKGEDLLNRRSQNCGTTILKLLPTELWTAPSLVTFWLGLKTCLSEDLSPPTHFFIKGCYPCFYSILFTWAVFIFIIFVVFYFTVCKTPWSLFWEGNVANESFKQTNLSSLYQPSPQNHPYLA